MKYFNELTPDQLERLAILSEECGEAIQIVGKIMRHGYESTHPDGGPTNRELLEKEMADVAAVVRIMLVATDVDASNIEAGIAQKVIKLDQYLHHQRVDFNSTGFISLDIVGS